MTSKPNPPKSWKGWAIYWPARAAPHRNRIACIVGCPMVYGTKRDALLDCEEGQVVRRVEIREAR